MKDRIFLALVMIMIAKPALAQTRPLAVPEPATLTLFGVGVAGAYIAKKFRRRR